MSGGRRIEDLLAIMEQLRDPKDGCPWDRRQTFASIAPYTIEEAYEVADAIARGDFEELRDELGDLLFQVAFYAQMAKEMQEFEFGDVVSAICEKMVRRHPHVFADADYASEAELGSAWEQHKLRERAARHGEEAGEGVARALPALLRAQKLQRRAARAGLERDGGETALDAARTRLQEIEAVLCAGAAEGAEKAVSDLLFATVSLARHLGVDAEGALREANDGFESRVKELKATLGASGRVGEQAKALELAELWAGLAAARR